MEIPSFFSMVCIVAVLMSSQYAHISNLITHRFFALDSNQCKKYTAVDPKQWVDSRSELRGSLLSI